MQLTKVNWRLKVNWKNFQEFFWKIFPIDFIVVNHVLWVNSIANNKSQLEFQISQLQLQNLLWFSLSQVILRTTKGESIDVYRITMMTWIWYSLHSQFQVLLVSMLSLWCELWALLGPLLLLWQKISNRKSSADREWSWDRLYNNIFLNFLAISIDL